MGKDSAASDALRVWLRPDDIRRTMRACGCLARMAMSSRPAYPVAPATATRTWRPFTEYLGKTDPWLPSANPSLSTAVPNGSNACKPLTSRPLLTSGAEYLYSSCIFILYSAVCRVCQQEIHKIHMKFYPRDRKS